MTRYRAALAAVMGVGLAIRVAFVVVRQSSVELVTGDAFWYHFQAHLVSTGRGFLNPFEFYKNGVVAPGADHPPGFVLVLAALDGLGIDSPQGQRLVMCVVGTATIAVIAALTRRLAGPRAALIAAGVAAVYPNLWINDGMLMVETVFILAVAVTLLFTYRFLAQPSRSDLAVVSAALTVAAMTRPEAIVMFPLLVVPLVAARTLWSWRERILSVALAALIPVLAFAPWVAYNLSRFDEPVYLSTGAGQTLAVGNCDLTYAGRQLGFYDLGCLLEPEIDPPVVEDPSARDLEYREIALDYMGDHVSDLPRVVAARVGRIWHVYAVDQQLDLDAFVEGRGGNESVRAALVGYYTLMPFAVAGLVVLRRRRVAIYPMLAWAGLATFVAATTFGVTRYRAGFEIVIVVAAALAVDRVLARRWPPPAEVGTS